MQIKSAKIHENYDDYTVDYDVCVITVSIPGNLHETFFDNDISLTLAQRRD